MKLNFQIEDLYQKEDEIVVHGRNCGSTIHLNDLFFKIYTNSFNEDYELSLINEAEIICKVQKIYIGIKEIEFLERGYTGKIILLVEKVKEKFSVNKTITS